METKDQLLAVINAADASSQASPRVGRLLTTIELDEVSGADGASTCGGPGGHTQSSSPFTQAGGTYYQGSGSPYNMTCKSAQ